MVSSYGERVAGTCTIIQTKCCGLVLFFLMPGESASNFSLLVHMKAQVNTLSDPTPSLDNLLAHWSGCTLGENLLLILGLLLLSSFFFFFRLFSCMCLYCCCGLCLQCSQLATKQATSPPMKPFTDHLRHLAEEVGVKHEKILRDSHEG